MKSKLLMFIATLVASAGSIGVQAQTYVDVTDTYLANAGFNSDIIYDISATGNLASANGGANIKDVQGWPIKVFGDNSASATFAFGCPMTLNAPGPVPTTDQSSNSTGGMLGVSAAWGASVYYGQTITLPAGKYRLTYVAYNSGPNANDNSLVGWYPATGTKVASAKTSFTLNTWVTESLTFSLATATTGEVRVGVTSPSSVGSGGAGRIFFDYVTLEFDATVDKTELNSVIAAATILYGSGDGNEANALSTAIATAEAVANNSSATIEQVAAAAIALNAAISDYKIANASPSNPIDMTSKIVNPSFEIGSLDGWVNNGMQRQGNDAFPKVGTYYCEKYTAGAKMADASISQTITGLPNGKYQVTVNGKFGDKGAYVFANAAKTQFNSDNNVADFSVETVVTDGSLNLGVRVVNSEQELPTTTHYLPFDDFRLAFLGVDLGAFEDALSTQLTTASDAKYSVQADYYAAADYSSFQSAYTNAQTIYNKVGHTANELTAAAASLQNAITNADISIAAKSRNDLIHGNSDADITFVITNPNFDNETAGWTTNMGTFNGANTKWTGWDTDYASAPGTNIVLDGGAAGISYGYQSFPKMPVGYYLIKAVARGQALTPSNLFFFINNGTSYENTGTVEGTATVERIGDTGGALNYGFARYTTSGINISEGENITLGMRLDNGGTGRWQSADAFQLFYYATEVDFLGVAKGELVNAANALLNSKMDATVKDALSAAINADWSNFSVADFQTALTSLRSAISTAETSIAAYTLVNTFIDGHLSGLISPLSENSLTVTSLEALKNSLLEGYNNGTLASTDIATFFPLIETALTADLATGTTDLTSTIVNPIPVDETGWNLVEKGNTWTTTGQFPENNSKRYFDSWAGSNLKFTVNQVITLDAGTYALSAIARGDGNGAFIYANDGTTTFKKEIYKNGSVGGGIGNGWSTTPVAFTLNAPATVTIGLSNNPTYTGGSAWTGSWYSVADFKLYMLNTTSVEIVDGAATVTGELTDDAIDELEAAGITSADLTNATGTANIVFANPNTVVYNVPAGVTTNGITEGSTALLSEAHPFNAPAALDANVSYQRAKFTGTSNDNGDNGWQSIVLPFDVIRIASIDGNNDPIELVPFGDKYDNDNENRRPFWLFRLENGNYVAADAIEANVTYLISFPNDLSYNAVFNVNGPVTFYGEEIVATTGLTPETLQGSYTLNPNFNGLVSDVYALNAEGSMWKKNSSVNSFFGYVTDPANVTSQYLPIFGETTGMKEISAKGMSNQNVVIVVTDNGVTIESEKAGRIMIYTMDGKKVKSVSLQEGSNFVALPAGEYVINGITAIVK